MIFRNEVSRKHLDLELPLKFQDVDQHWAMCLYDNNRLPLAAAAPLDRSPVSFMHVSPARPADLWVCNL